jgi:hypothetical protein
VSHLRGRLSRLCAATDSTLAAVDDTLLQHAAQGCSHDAFALLVPLTKKLSALRRDVGECMVSVCRPHKYFCVAAASATPVSFPIDFCLEMHRCVCMPWGPQEALTSLLADRTALEALSTSNRKSKLPSEAFTNEDANAGDAVSSALRGLHAVQGELNELMLHITSTREAWELQLAGTRNRLQRAQVWSLRRVCAFARDRPMC